MSFESQLRSFSTKTGISFDKVLRKVVIDITSDIVRMTPVDTGHARSNYFWGVQRDTTSISHNYKAEAARGALESLGSSYGHGPLTKTEFGAVRTIMGLTGAKTMKGGMSRIQGFVTFEASGKESVARAFTFAGSVKAGGVCYITNNLPYIMALEFGAGPNPFGHGSQQAPAGMARVTVAKWQGIVNAAVRAL